MVGDLLDPPAAAASDRVIAPFRTFMHLSGDDQRRRALSAAAALLTDGGRFIFDVFEPSAADIRATHDRWIARREGISERPLWDAAERRLELEVRLPGRVVPMTLEWRSAAEWRALCAEAGLTVLSAESGFGGEPLDGPQGDQVYICARAMTQCRTTGSDDDEGLARDVAGLSRQHCGPVPERLRTRPVRTVEVRGAIRLRGRPRRPRV